MFWVYVLRSGKDNRLYKGMTNDLKRRLSEHNSGKHRSTAPYIPWTLVYSEELETRIEARKRELYFKSGRGREFLKKLLAP